MPWCWNAITIRRCCVPATTQSPSRHRISSRLGHLDNASAAALLAALDLNRLQHVVAAHLSQTNNRPELARGALAAALGCAVHWVAIAEQTGWPQLAPARVTLLGDRPVRPVMRDPRTNSPTDHKSFGPGIPSPMLLLRSAFRAQKNRPLWAGAMHSSRELRLRVTSSLPASVRPARRRSRKPLRGREQARPLAREPAQAGVLPSCCRRSSRVPRGRQRRGRVSSSFLSGIQTVGERSNSLKPFLQRVAPRRRPEY